MHQDRQAGRTRRGSIEYTKYWQSVIVSTVCVRKAMSVEKYTYLRLIPNLKWTQETMSGQVWTNKFISLVLQQHTSGNRYH